MNRLRHEELRAQHDKTRSCGSRNDREIVAVDPVALHSELSLYPLVKNGTRQRIGKRDADVVGTGAENE